MDIANLKTILEKHLHWIKEDCNGWEKMKANLSGVNLSGVNLSGADLSEADLSRANLSRANLSEANLYGANLYGANLYGANLYRANLYGANLYRANLSRANLSRANLSEANLYGANIDIKYMAKFYPLFCPEYGAFIAWKKANNMIIKLKIPEDAKRSSAFGRKCRASKAVCLAIENADGTQSDVKAISSNYDSDFIYKVGEMVEVKNFDDDRTHECAPGIHFFITRQEAVDYL